MEHEFKHCTDHGNLVSLADTVKSTSEDVKVIKDSLLGTLDKEGFVNKLRNLEAKVIDLETVKKTATGVTIAAVGQFIVILVGIIITILTNVK
jgi:hypothetical protein